MDPRDPITRNRERGSEREREWRKAVEGGGTQEEPEGGVGERGEQQIQRGHHHIAGFFYTGERQVFCVVADGV